MATKITLDQFFNRVDEFIINVMIPNMGSSMMRGLINAAARLGVARNFFVRKFGKGMSLLELMEISNIFDAQNGQIDIDMLERGIEGYFEVEEEYSQAGFHFTKSDFEQFVCALRGKKGLKSTTQQQEDALQPTDSTMGILCPRG